MVEELQDENINQKDTEETFIQRNLDEIETREAKDLIDAAKYEGLRARISEVVEEEVIDVYTGPEDDTGKPTYNPLSTVKKRIIKIRTEPLPVLNEQGQPTNDLVELGDGRKLQVESKFNLKKEKDESGNIKWVISKAPRASLWKFMRKMGVEKLNDLKNKYITLTAEPSGNPNDDRIYLKIVK